MDEIKATFSRIIKVTNYHQYQTVCFEINILNDIISNQSHLTQVYANEDNIYPQLVMALLFQ